MGIGELIDAAFRLYRLEWKTLIGVVALVIIPVTFLEVWVTQIMVGPISQVTGPDPDVFGQLLVLSLVYLAIQLLVVQPFLTAAITRAAADVYLGEPVGIGRTYRYAVGRMLSILWITILGLVAILLGFLLLVIPGVILLIRLAFAAPVLVVEDRRGTAAIRRSWRLSGGHFWRVLATVVVAGLIVAVIGAILSVPGELAVQSLGPDAWPLSTLVNALVSVLTTPFTTLVVVLLYFDLRIRKEGFDIEVLARELAAAP